MEYAMVEWMGGSTLTVLLGMSGVASVQSFLIVRHKRVQHTIQRTMPDTKGVPGNDQALVK